jgi:hypothetical protein
MGNLYFIQTNVVRFLILYSEIEIVFIILPGREVVEQFVMATQ